MRCFHVITVLLGLSCGVLGKPSTRDTEISNGNPCYPKLTVGKLNLTPERNLNIFNDFKFTCGGEIAAWKFYALKAGSFFGTVWRTYDDGRMELIGKNFIFAKTTGLQYYFVPKHLRFKVQSGDVVGVHYRTTTDPAIITYEDDSAQKHDKARMVSEVLAEEGMFDEQLQVGHVFKTIKKISPKRAPSLIPFFNRNKIKLVEGRTPHEGRAMFFDVEWGTICDDSFIANGWPTQFCKELGYNHAEVAEFAKDTYVGQGKDQVTYYNPSCGSALDMFMDECKRGKRCDHTKDVFVKCEYAVRLDNGNFPNEGRAMAYKGKRWGTVCDKTPKAESWPSTLCHELGYNHAVDAIQATADNVGIGTGTVMYKNPTCDATKPYHLSYCVKNHGSCSHKEDVFVSCQYGIRLVNGVKPTEGLAQVYKNGEWGTVCMNKLERDRFPALFCKQLGYDTIIEATYARKAYTGSGTGPITEMSPYCSPEDSASILNCGHPDTEPCDHTKDIFIVCDHQDKCNYLPCQNEGICYRITDGYKCECVPGFEGENCEIDIDECESSPCRHGGTCTDGVNTYECACPQGYSGTDCQNAAMPEGALVLRSFDDPTKSVHVPYLKTGEKNAMVELADVPTVFIATPGLANTEGSVSFEAKLNPGYYLRAFEGNLVLEHKTSARSPKDFNSDTSFFIEEPAGYGGNFILRGHGKNTGVVVHDEDKMVLAEEKENDKDFMASALFYIKDLDGENVLILYDKDHFTGPYVTLTESDAELRRHGFDNRMDSLEVKGSFTWELFMDSNYNGKKVIVSPGVKYDADWVQAHIGKNRVSSVRKLEVPDGLLLWDMDNQQGKHITVAESIKDVKQQKELSKVESVEVIGPSTWEVYSKDLYKGKKVVLPPGRYPKSWLIEHLGTADIRSARKVVINSDLCKKKSGTEKLKGNSGKEHNVFVVHRDDGSAWLRFGNANMEKTWKYKAAQSGVFVRNILDANDIKALQDFNIMGWEVDTDVDFLMTSDNSWHPSTVTVLNLGSRTPSELSLAKSFIDKTDVTFGANKKHIICTGRMQNGASTANVCGQNGLPEYGTTTNDVAITKVNFRPRGSGAHAENREYERNAFTWQGTYYFVYAKVASCASSSGCYKRAMDVSFSDKAVKEAKSEDRPNSFFFGQMGNDVDACEAACRAESDCTAYTLYLPKNKKTELTGGCYGVGKRFTTDGKNQTGVFSGKAMDCESFIPDYMTEDLRTRNYTGCPCHFDLKRKDCACCHEGSCQCEHQNKYQCTLCGFSERCGSPFLTTNNKEYVFEYDNLELTVDGYHYEIPNMCVSGCKMVVLGAGSQANKMVANINGRDGSRVVSCVANDLQNSQDVMVEVSGTSLKPKGGLANMINLYSYGGQGTMIQLRLKINKEGCSDETKNSGYAGCFKNPKTEHSMMTSNKMTQPLCIQHCYNHGFPYAALQAGTNCDCYRNLPTSGSSQDCDILCSGDSNHVCGGVSSKTIYHTSQPDTRVIMATSEGGCSKIGAELLSSSFIMASQDECKKMTGADVSGDDIIECSVDWCGAPKIVDGGLFAARPGSCGNNKQGEGYLQTPGGDCLAMGGEPEMDDGDWGHCKLDFCYSDKPKDSIYAPSTDEACPAHVSVSKVDMDVDPAECIKMGGNTDDPDRCELTMCVMDRNPSKPDVYDFAHNNEDIEKDANHEYKVKEMCVTKCILDFKAKKNGTSKAEVTFADKDGKPAGLYCGGESKDGDKMRVVDYSDMPTGVKVSRIGMAAKGNDFKLLGLKLEINPDGCQNNGDFIVLYEEPNFGGEPRIIKKSIDDLSDVDFNDKTSSFRIFGKGTWELFEGENHKGSRIYLTAGDYGTADVLPFGSNSLSSIHKMPKNMTDVSREEISNTKGLVCFKRTTKQNAVFGLIPNGPRTEDRPHIFYFGEFGSDIDGCERQCRAEKYCAAFTLFSPEAEAEQLKDWRGLCYGRSFMDDVQVYQEAVLSGTVAPCSEEDTLTFYKDKKFAGGELTIIEDDANITSSKSPLSAIVTGKDNWRVLSTSKGYVHTYNLSPGEYPDLSKTIVGDVFQVYKLNPNKVQLHEAQNGINLSPVAIDQIKEVITIVDGGSNIVDKKDCNETHKADVAFVLDASGSVRKANFKTVLEFVVDVIDSFNIGKDKVRVSAVVFSKKATHDIKVEDYDNKKSLVAAIRKLKYPGGVTHTDKALRMLWTHVFTKKNTRDGVPKQAIVITDGRSKDMGLTSSEAHKCRAAGIIMTAVGIKGAVEEELYNIAGDASRVFNVNDFSLLGAISDGLKQTTCADETKHVAITVPGDDSKYFEHEDIEFKRVPAPLGMEAGMIYDPQIFASSAIHGDYAETARLNHKGGWMTNNDTHTNGQEWIEIDLGRIIPIHGIATQGHGSQPAWVKKYKIAVSLDGITFVTFKETNSSSDLIFIGNNDQNTVKYHCLHRLFGGAIKARVIRFIPLEWTDSIGMRIELYGFRDPNDHQLLAALREDVWTANITGCMCYFDTARFDCACCEDGGCQCQSTDYHQCVQCGSPHECGIPNIRHPEHNVDGWTRSMSGCPCLFDPQKTDCACCQNMGCQCGSANKNQCVNCGHPKHCGAKESIFGQNPYCYPRSCPYEVTTIWKEHPHMNSKPVVEEPKKNETLVHNSNTVLTFN